MSGMTSYIHRLSLALIAVTVFALITAAPVIAESTAQKFFASSQAAITALIDAARKNDRAGMLAVLGSETEQWITSGDPVQDRKGLERFIAAFNEKNQVEEKSDSKAVLVVGSDGYPFPFPLIKSSNGWAFHPEQGKEEILNRRIGRNELNTVQVLLAVNDAQREYAAVDRDGDGVLEYASRFRSSPGKQDGLYWPSGGGESDSPLGPLVADAVREGYKPKQDGSDNDETQAYHGYHFKLLARQGADAPGGAYDYSVAGNMIGGFAVLAYPARYGNSGVMTFMISHDGKVFDADLGPDTEAEAGAMDTFNPVEGWKSVEPE